MKFIPTKLLMCLAWMVLAGHMECQAAPTAATPAIEEPSVELGNVDGPDSNQTDAPGAQAGTTQAAAQTAGQADTVVGDDAPAATSGDPKAQQAAAAAPAKAAAATPMEKYRDAKLQAATTPNGVNPASARRYLKIDRATYQESIGGVQ